MGCILLLTSGLFAHAVQDSLFEKALDAESAGDIVLTVALLEEANSYQGNYNDEIQEILDSYYEVLRMKDATSEVLSEVDSNENKLNWMARLELVGIKYDEFGDSLSANEYSGEAYLNVGAEYEIRQDKISHFLLFCFASDVFMREDGTVFDTSRWAFTPSLEYTIQSERFVVSLGGDVNISERDGAVFSGSLSAERDFYLSENFRAGVSGFGYLNDNLRIRAKLGGYYEYRPLYGFWTNVAVSGRFERDTSVSAYFWRYEWMNEYGPDSVQERYYQGHNFKIGPELRLQLGYRFNSSFSVDFLGNLYWSYNPYEDEWMTFEDNFDENFDGEFDENFEENAERRFGPRLSTWNRQSLQGSMRLRGNWKGKHFGTYLSVGTYFRRYLGLPSGHPEIYSNAYILGEIRLGATFRF
ncbi:MAG: hypothetical protein J6Z31_05050 [Fibrobacter sp.]|nr:hypothetical protein [Fibrobacter sp.]